MIPFKAPEFKAKAFNCPHCKAYAQQEWCDLWDYMRHEPVPWLKLAYCVSCKQYSLWHEEHMLYPSGGTAPFPNPDLPEEIKQDYEEARSIGSLSPRGAAALLRLAIQKLCQHLGEKGKDLNDDIANLVRKGLPTSIQQALDIVRVIGNNAVHPGQIDVRDDPAVAESLFGLVNLIADRMITQPKQIEQLYEKLPSEAKEQIRRRDGGVS